MTNKPDFDELTRDVDWQRASFLKYCLEVTESESSGGGYEEAVVRKILGGYLVLALLFYKQIREDLKTHYVNLSDIGEVEVRVKIQEAMDKLVDEWLRVYAITVALRARRANKESKRLLTQMDPFLDEAMRDVALSRNEFPVVLEFGQSYSLRFSNYSSDFAALSIPLWVLESPWEWTILWHELAGEKVRKLKNDEPVFFASLYEQVMDLLKDDQKSAALDAGWSIDWLEELFEDSFSVIHFPIHFLFVFKNVLGRQPDGGKGQRHPSHAVRLATAMFLHQQMKLDAGLPDDIQKWGTADWMQWTELEQETFPNRFKIFDPKKQLSNPIDVKLVQLVGEKIFRWHQVNKVDENSNNPVFKKTIAKAIIDYSREANYQVIFNAANAALTNLTPGVDTDVPETPAYFKLCSIIREKKGLLQNLPQDVLEENPQVKKLLADLGYQQLLEISFSKTDFHNKDDVRLSLGIDKYWVDRTTWHTVQSTGKFQSYDPAKPLKLGFIEIKQLDPSNDAVTQLWQAVPSVWEGLQKKTT